MEPLDAVSRAARVAAHLPAAAQEFIAVCFKGVRAGACCVCVGVVAAASGILEDPAHAQRTAPAEGRALFDSHCSACHQYDDSGTGEAPPLDRSPWVAGPPERLIRILLHGVSGRIEVNGKIYDREMPGFGGVLSDRQIASLATYTRNRFGAGDGAVTPAAVKRIRERHAGRARYWPADELLEIR